MSHSYRFRRTIAISLLFTALPLFLEPRPSAQVSQNEHDRAQAAQNARDKRHHTTAKTVGGAAAGGALIGGVAGGGKGSLIGGAAGAGTGIVADKIRKHKGVQKRERQDSERPKE
jgi:outer membrane lipoprotein SlyB